MSASERIAFIRALIVALENDLGADALEPSRKSLLELKLACDAVEAAIARVERLFVDLHAEDHDERHWRDVTRAARAARKLERHARRA